MVVAHVIKDVKPAMAPVALMMIPQLISNNIHLYIYLHQPKFNFMTQLTTTAQLRTMFSREDVMQRLQSVLGKRASTFTTSVLQIVQSNDLLSQSDPSSVLNAAMVAATLDLPLNNQLGFAYIVPFNTRQKDGSTRTLAQFQLGYKGFIQLAQRSGQFKTIDAKAVYEGQLVQDNTFGGISFNWANKTSENVIGYAAYFQLLNGFEKILYMTNAELTNHGSKYSQTFKRGYGLWHDQFDSMAKKTVIKLLLSKYAPLSVDMQRAVMTDQAVVDDDGDVKYIDNTAEKVDVDLVYVSDLIANASTVEQLEMIEKSCSDDIKSQLRNEFNAKKSVLTGTFIS
ncbi:MAG: recombinase [Rhodobacteraceae bacterium]|nr:recombinase [Paracoccaceae bacterium]